MSRQVDWAQRIAALANTGLHYTRNHYDRERYSALRDIAAEMLADSAKADVAEIALLLSADDGYITPKIDVRGAVFRQDKILLVREAVDGLWTLPGGWADVGDSPSAAVEREIREESGYLTKAVKLLALEDRRLRHPPMAHAAYKVAFLCQLLGGEAQTSAETTAVDWFAEDEIPPLSLGRVTAGQIRRWFDHYRQPQLPTDFD